MRDFSAAAVVTAYLQVSVIAGEQGLGSKLNTVFTSIAAE
jgi:Flp pilus assembly pilin Flp